MQNSEVLGGNSIAGPRYEWPTVLLIGGVYGCWITLAMNYHHAGAWLTAPLLTFVIALHGSMCHELIHGHPTRVSWLNDLLGRVPLGIFLPYTIYRESHLQHHRDEYITLPGKDPESYFISAEEYEKRSAAGKALAWVLMTVAGRLILHPLIEIFRLARHLVESLVRLDVAWITTWVIHLTSATLLLVLVVQIFDIPLWHYLVIAYAASSLTRIRSFYEHRPVDKVEQRSVLMEPNPILRFLFLDLNYHLLHHEAPQIPWYRMHDYYRQKREQLILRSNNFHYTGYHLWLLKHLLKPVASPVHPFA